MDQTVSVYYDETYLDHEKCHGHVLFFVPDLIETSDVYPLFGKISNSYSPRQDLLREILKIRNEKGKDHKFHFSNISGIKWGYTDSITKKMIDMLIDSLRSKGISTFKQPVSCKVAILYYPKSAKTHMFGGDSKKEKRLRFTETTLRILLKGACHFLYDENHKISVSRFIVDGFPAHREFDDHRIIGKLNAEVDHNRTPLRNYVDFAPNIQITHILSDHTGYDSCSIEYEDANLLQCADLLLGSINYAIFQPGWTGKRDFQIDEICDDKKRFLSHSTSVMLRKLDRKAGFINSSHYLSFSVSKLILEGEELTFQNAGDLIERGSNPKSNQLQLPC